MPSLTRLGANAVRVAALGSALAWSATAHAQASQKATAEALFEEGRKLMAEGKVADACPKFADSEQLDASSSTLLNLASCYEKLGRTASAWATYREAASLANANGRADHMAVAQKRADALSPKLSRVTVTVAAPAEGLEIKRDGTAVTRAEWGVAIPVDPGPHNYEVTAPGRRSWGASIQVGTEGAATTLNVPALDPVPTPGPGATAAAASPASPKEPAPLVPGGAPASAPQDAPPHTQRTFAWVFGGVGVVGLAVGTVFALRAKSKYDDSLASCSTTNKDVCSSDGVSKRDDARVAGDIATVSYFVGAGALAGAAILWLTAPRDASSSSVGLQVMPSLGIDGGGATVRGRW